MKVQVDQEKCIGCGMCIDTINEVFDYNDEGLAHVIKKEIEEENIEEVEQAAESCPTGAIEIK